jgi:hypothetical protein
VVAIEQDLSRNGRIAGNRPRAWMLVAIATALLTVAGWAARGFSENGLRLGSEFARRFTFLIYFLAIVAGPIARLMPLPSLRRLCEARCQLIWGFSASFAVYLLGVLVPNLLLPGGPDEDGLTGSMATFALFGAALSGIIAFAARRDAARILGEKARTTILGVGLSTFWLAYALSGLAHITGPHRPDMFYGTSLSLMILALLLRFADCMAAKIRGRREPV